MAYTERIVSQQIGARMRPIEEKVNSIDENIKRIMDTINAKSP